LDVINGAKQRFRRGGNAEFGRRDVATESEDENFFEGAFDTLGSSATITFPTMIIP